jgi:hypothetical protein
MAKDTTRLNGHAIIRAAAFVALLAGALAQSDVAVAFPDLTRTGATCQACHVSPTGGGALTDYGRLRSASTLSTWGSETHAQPLFGLFPKTAGGIVAVGGDQRLLRVAAQRGAEPPTFLTIPMQYDVELAVTPTPALTVAASWGVYGPELEEQSRRHYVLARLGEHATARAGRFFPAYGLGGADHTTYARRSLGFDEGAETVNGELGLWFEDVDLVATAIYGRDAAFSASHERGYDTDTEDDAGAVVRAQLRLGEASTVGVSCLTLASYERQRRACGMHAVTSLTRWLWSTSDWSALLTERDCAGTSTLSVEPWKGVVVSLQGEAQRTRQRAGLQLQWFPVPHVELLLLGRREVTAAGEAYSAIGMIHHYL